MTTLTALRASSLARGERPVPPVDPPPQEPGSHGARLGAAPAMSVAAAKTHEGTRLSLSPQYGGGA
jgi:hypothetical protein